ncbi:MAG TPA: hypothetical protein VHM20_03940 [Gammaproteobacteria bacterium]|jgi:hypothetical protein|nr:hypothetical protein [Gammaproteobacteria bacterium]
MHTKKVYLILFLILNILFSTQAAKFNANQKQIDHTILYVETTANALNQIKALYKGYYYTNFDLQAGMLYYRPLVFPMYEVDKNGLDSFIPVDNDKLQVPSNYDFIYPSLAVSYNPGGDASGTGFLSCENKNGNVLMLDPKKLIPGRLYNTYITFTDVYLKSVPPFTMYVTHCTCSGPACVWQARQIKTHKKSFLSGTNLSQTHKG